jgi:hypothetical protein
MNKPKVLLDSGAYTAHKKKITIDIDKYAQFVVEEGHKFAGCFNLDSIGNAKTSYLNWKYLKDAGAETIPVYHVGTPEIWIQKYLKQTDYIGLGAIANLDTQQRLYGLGNIWKKYLIDEKGFPKFRVHGLGLTAIPIMLRYPWYSLDSFTPVISAVWGSVLLPDIRTGDPRYLGLKICKISDQGEHKKGMANSFPNLPKSWQRVYNELFEKHGFLLGDIAYQEKRARRGKKEEHEKKLKPMDGMVKIVPSNPDVKTLANSWEVRMHFNLVMWNHLRERLPIYPRPFEGNEPTYKEEVNTHTKTIMFMGVSTTTHLQIFEKVRPKLDILISYAYLNESISESINNYVK